MNNSLETKAFVNYEQTSHLLDHGLCQAFLCVITALTPFLPLSLLPILLCYFAYILVNYHESIFRVRQGINILTDIPEKFYFLLIKESQLLVLVHHANSGTGGVSTCCSILPRPPGRFTLLPESDVAAQMTVMNSVWLINQCLYPKEVVS